MTNEFKKLENVFRRSRKWKEKRHREIRIKQTEEKEIIILIWFNEYQIKTLIDSVTDYNCINSKVTRKVSEEKQKKINDRIARNIKEKIISTIIHKWEANMITSKKDVKEKTTNFQKIKKFYEVILEIK